jgi:hypothetical protein
MLSHFPERKRPYPPPGRAALATVPVLAPPGKGDRGPGTQPQATRADDVSRSVRVSNSSAADRQV